MKINMPDNLKGKELFAYLVKNKPDLIKKKCAMIINKEAVSLNPLSVLTMLKDGTLSNKDAGVMTTQLAPGQALVDFIANTMLYCDSHMDVMGIDSFKKTIKESGPAGKDKVYHLMDHEAETCAIVGYIESLELRDFNLSELGIGDSYGVTQALVTKSLVKTELDEKTFILYRDGKIKQHSVGIQYVKLELCVNDADYPEELAAWNKYYSLVINKDVVDKKGYFWFCAECKLFEISTVLFGSNEVTQVIGYQSGDDEDEPEEKSTHEDKPSADTYKEKNSFKFSEYLKTVSIIKP